MDNGKGIPDSDKEKIFGHGFGKHTGIGLALSKEILSITGITIRETGQAGQGASLRSGFPREHGAGVAGLAYLQELLIETRTFVCVNPKKKDTCPHQGAGHRA